MTKKTIWLRNESRVTERRTPLLPEGARALIKDGYSVVVERSPKRIIDDEAYATAGCRMVEGGAWLDAPKDAIILGLKELPPRPALLKNTHIYFAHAYKAQSGWRDLLSRFTAGGGDLLDIEYMVQEDGARVVAFGYWAGYMGAALALIHWHDLQSGQARYLDHGLQPFADADQLNDTIHKAETAAASRHRAKPRVLVIGASGRCGRGALEILQQHDAVITCWGRDQTRKIDRAALLDHDILINCAFILEDVPAFLRTEDLTPAARLAVVADVSCDPFSSFNPIPLYHETTTWDNPYITVEGRNKSVDVIAIDNLPSLIPRESSADFAGQLLPYLKTLNDRDRDPVWRAAGKSFDKAVRAMENGAPKRTKKRA